MDLGLRGARALITGGSRGIGFAIADALAAKGAAVELIARRADGPTSHAAEIIRAGLPHLRSAGGGAVVIISSITDMRPAPRTTYAVTKAAEIQLAATAAAELAADNIRVNAVSPGSIFFPGGSWDRFSR